MPQLGPRPACRRAGGRGDGQLKVAAQVVSENPRLYYEIQQGNAMTGQVVGQFRDALDALARAVRTGDEVSWTRAMEMANRRIASDKR